MNILLMLFSISSLIAQTKQILPIPEEKRLALLIGNNYKGEKCELTNCLSDIDSMKIILHRLHFDTLISRDENKAQLDSLVKNFCDKVTNEEYNVLLIYYSGHGIMNDGNIYIVPDNVSFRQIMSGQNSLDSLLYNIQSLLDFYRSCTLGYGKNKNFLIWDACLESPFPRKHQNTTRALIEYPQYIVYRGTTLVLGTNLGSRSSDGKHANNGLFTESLLQCIGEDIEIKDMLKIVAQNVSISSNKAQQPQIIANTDEFYINHYHPNSMRISKDIDHK